MKNGKYTGEELNAPKVKYAWYKDDLLHRENGPAREWKNGKKEWYFNGELHRLGGPAYECSDVTKQWYVNGKHHRLDGPAVEWYNGDKAWVYHGEYINCNSQEEFERFLKLLAFK